MTVLPPPPPPPPPSSTSSAHAFASTCAGDGSRGTAAAYAWSRHAGKRAPPPPPPPHRTTAAAVTSSAASAAATASPGTSSNGNDRLVQQTNDDSVVSKRSAVAQHYFDDVFLRYFVHKPARRSPLINRGYYLRMVVMTDVVTRSVYHLLKLQQQQQRQQPVEATTTAAAPSTDARPAVQVVSIGAGYDTLAFRLLHARSPWRLPEDAGVVRFYEIDFPAVMAAKATLMRAAPPDTFADEWLQQMPSPVVQTTTTPPSSSLSRTTSASSSSDSVTTVATTTTRSATSDGTTTTTATATAMSPLCRCGACRYHAVGVDLRGDGAAASWLATLRRTCAHFSPDVPTVIYAECVTQYLPPHDTAALLRAIAAAFPTAVWVSYDQLRPHDSFGALMCRALQQRGAPLLGIRACASGRAATRRALRCGFACAVFANFFDLSRHHLCGAERARVDALEAFDEAEEWSEMCAHYGLTLAATQPQLTAGVLAAVPALQVVAPMCVPTCTPPPPSHAQQQPQQQPYARACSASDTRATMTAVACTHGSKASNKHSNKPNGSGASCRVEQREWPSGGRFAFDGWGNGGAAVEVDDRGDDANGNGDVVVVCFGGFEVGRSHQRVNRVYCHSLRRGELTVVATLLRNHDGDEQQQQQQQPPRRLQAQTSSGSNAEGGKPSCTTPREATATAPQMPARVFHTFTRLRACCYVVFGGRSNPSAASNTAYLLECEHDSIFATTASSTSVVAATWRELRLVRARRGARSGGSSSDHDIDDDDERDDVVGRAVSCMISRADDDDDDDDSAAVSTPPVPEPRYRHTATAISPRELFVFGGRSATGAFLGDAWLATIDTDAGTIAWRRVSLHGHDVPAALCSAAAVAVPRDDDDDDNNNDGNNSDAAAVAAATDDESARRRRSCDNNKDNADAEASAVVVVLSGGLQYGERCSNALWWIDVRSGRCVRVTAVCAAVGARFSHTLTRLRVDGRDTLLVLGGCVCEARAAERTDDDDQDDDDADADVAGYGCGVANANGSSGNGGEEGVVVPAAVLLDVAALRQYVTQQQQRQLQQQQQLLLLQQQRSGGGGGGGEDELVQCTSPTMPPAASSDMSSAPLAQPLVLPRTCPSWARHACVSVGDGVVAVMGGGYACFSFGTFTAKPCLLCLGQQHALNTSRSSNSHNNTVTRVSWTATTATTATTAAATAAPSRHHDDNNATNTRTRPSHAPPPPSPHSRVAALPHRAAVLLSLPRRPPVLELPYSAETFVRVATLAQRPVVFRRVPLGACVARWASPAYLKAAEGDTVVSVHVAPPGAYLLDFVKKNFRFAHVRFRELVDHVVAATATAAAAHTPTDGNDGNDGNDNNTTTATRGETWYYRSIAARMRSERADVWRDFARLGADFVLPPGAHEYIMPRLHQSCLRINAPPLQLWTHYDTRDNVLCQIVGHKRVVFFPPSAYNHLYMTGSSSAVLDLDAPDVLQYPRFVDACKCATEVMLGPGDMVYFPAQWFHHVTTLVEHGNRHDVDDDSGDMREARGNDDNDNATAPYSVSVNVFFDHFATGEYDAKDLYGNKDPLACTALQQAIVTQTQQLLRGAQLLHTSAPLPSEYVEFALRQAIAQLERVADELAAGRRGERVAAVTSSSSSSSSSTASANKT